MIIREAFNQKRKKRHIVYISFIHENVNVTDGVDIFIAYEFLRPLYNGGNVYLGEMISGC
ncbi:MAG: hypothetical protein ACI8VC_001674 [Candidatus Endobugula sp.]|jgi:hypothetical protein